MSSSLKNTVINDTGHILLPVGPSTQRTADNARTIVTYTSGSGTWTVPTGVSNINVLVVGGGGGGGNCYANSGTPAGGGGGGGVIFRNNYPVTPGGTINYTVGLGGAGSTVMTALGQVGQTSFFGTGTNLVPDPGFNSGITSWGAYNSTLSWYSSNSLRATSTTTNAGVSGTNITISTTIGKTYFFKADVTQAGVTGNDTRIQISGVGLQRSSGQAVTANTTTIYDYYTATSTSHIIEILMYNTAIGATLTIDNVEIYNVTDNLVAIGGGGGASGNYSTGNYGGSGGGASGGGSGGLPLFTGLGYPGAGGYSGAGQSRASGGGGAGGPGSGGDGNICGGGGPGLYFNISGSMTAYGGGGGAGGSSSGFSYPGLGGVGGGGAGGNSGDANGGVVGSPNTGGGGGGGAARGGSTSNGGAGGSGVIVISYYTTPTGESQIRYNTTSNTPEIFERMSGWVPTDPTQNMAVGGEVESTNGYRIHYFTQTGVSYTFTPQYSGTVELLVVGGGGAGGVNGGGGGGGGGVIVHPQYPVVANTAYTVTVGAGGTSTATQATRGTVRNGSGGNSSFGSLVAIGGGAAGQRSDGNGGLGNGAQGGSGGGGGGQGNSAAQNDSTYDGDNYGGYVWGQGNAGGNGYSGAGSGGGGGGGGAGSPGGISSTGSGNVQVGGTGGDGRVCLITGVLFNYGAGGGGAPVDTGMAGPPGMGGTGVPGQNSTGGLPATPNTGSGGGSNDDLGTYNYNGASGLVVVRYRAPTACETFYFSSTWTCPPGVTSVQILTVGAGGGGGTTQYADRGAGGGGAGAVIYRSSQTVVPGTTYPVTVGLGGFGGQQYVNATYNGTCGGFSAFGTNLIQNGDFGSSAGWSVGTNISISGGVAVYSSPSHGTNLLQTGISFTAGVTYAVHFTVTSFTSGSLTLYGNYSTGTNTQVAFNIAQSIGNYYYTWTAATNGTGFSLQANAINNGACSMTIDNVAIFDITNGVLAAGGGGGAGVGGTPAGQPGGSGGGGRNTGAGGAAYTGGNSGGAASIGGGGGGGAGGTGSAGGSSSPSATGGNGGAGVVYSISGKAKVYGGGGGGGNTGYSQATDFTGSGSGLSAGSNQPGNGGGVNGIVVGGYGGSFLTIPGGPGVNGTGSGGGGGGAIANSGIAGSAGASGSGGVVIIRWGN